MSNLRPSTAGNGKKGQVLPTGVKECTFTPRTNPIKPNMESAIMYLETDIFERYVDILVALIRHAGNMSLCLFVSWFNISYIIRYT